ncbi:MAG: fatty acid desaturase [Kiloniellales bacterium]|nr:fatty acid desaturase [Kiloniellales bacterium]
MSDRLAGHKATGAASSGVALDKRTLKQLMRRSDLPGLKYLAIWAVLLGGSGFLLYQSFSFGLFAVVPAMLLFGAILTVPAYSLSHECSHGTAFKTRWLNESVLFITSLIYLEGPYFRRYAHARHHTYTWLRGLDAQMPFNTPLSLKGWFLEVSGFGQYLYDFPHLVRNAFGRFHPDVVAFTPKSELPKLKWEARAFLAIYAGGAFLAVWHSVLWPLYFLVLPRILGGVAMQLFTIIQHAEMEEDNPDIKKSTRSFATNWFGNFLYANMANHVEHHLYPTVPFYNLPAIREAVAEQVHEPDDGLLRTNWKVFRAVLNRTFSRSSPVAGENTA